LSSEDELRRKSPTLIEQESSEELEYWQEDDWEEDAAVSRIIWGGEDGRGGVGEDEVRIIMENG